MRTLSTSSPSERIAAASLVARSSAPPRKNGTWESRMATRTGGAELDKRRIIVDCTHTFHTGAFTGIQRVVRNLTEALLRVAQSSGLQVVPVRVARGGLVALA